MLTRTGRSRSSSCLELSSLSSWMGGSGLNRVDSKCDTHSGFINVSIQNSERIFFGGAHDVTYGDNQLAANLKYTAESELDQHNELQAYEQTEVFNIAVQKLLVYRKVILVSGQGCGKTCLGKELLVHFNSSNNDSFNKKTPIIMRYARDWHVTIEPNEDAIVLLDDIFGKICLDNAQLAEWEKIFPDINTCINDKSTSVNVIFTIRNNVFRCISETLKRYDLFKNFEHFVISLDEPKNLSMTCKRNILIRHFAHPRSNTKCYSIQNDQSESEQAQNCIPITETDIEAILSTTSMFAFPLCCAEYVNNEIFFNQGPSFFTRPVDLLYLDIQRLCEMDKSAFFLLTSVFFSRLQKLDLRNYKEAWLREIATFCSVNEPFRISRTLNDKIREFTDIYVSVTGPIVTFKAEVLSEVMLRVIAYIDMPFLIETSDLSVLKTYTTMENSSGKVYFSPNHFNALIQRFLQELDAGNVEEVGGYEGMSFQPFVDEFYDTLQNKRNYFQSVHQKDKKSNKTLFLSACYSDPPRYPLIKSFLDNPPIKRRLCSLRKISKRLTNQLYSSFERACSSGNTELSCLLLRYIRAGKISDNTLFNAAKSGNEDVLQWFITAKPGHLKRLQRLREYTVNVKSKRSPLLLLNYKNIETNPINFKQ